MGLFKPRTWGVGKVLNDIQNYKDWIRVIKREESNANSNYSKWKLSHNYFYTLYFTHQMEQTEAQLPENIMKLRMIESLAPLHRYLDEDLGFAGYITPSFNQFYDDDNEPTLTYLVMYRFSFDQLSIWWFIKFLIKWSALITLLVITIKQGWISQVIGWLTSI